MKLCYNDFKGSDTMTRGFQAPKARSALYLYFSWSNVLKTVTALMLATLFSYLLWTVGLSSETDVIMVYILSVLVVSRITDGFAFGIIASVLAVLCYNFFFTEPYFTLIAYGHNYPLTFVIMLLVALITSAVTARAGHQAVTAVKRQKMTEILYDINKKLLATRGRDNIVELCGAYISQLFERSVVFYTDCTKEKRGAVLKIFDGELKEHDIINENEWITVKWVLENKSPAGANTEILPGSAAFYAPVVSQGQVLGIVGISCVAERVFNDDNREFLKMIISLIAMALERQQLSDYQSKIGIEAEKEKLRSNLLRAIAHDLRTPLTGISGASTAILESGSGMPDEIMLKLAKGIRDDSEWLIRMVENLLSVTRIYEGTMNVQKRPEAVEEVISEAVHRVRKRSGKHSLNIKIPNELLVVPMDGTLIEQVLINLIENAFKYTNEDSTIDVIVDKNDGEAVFQVIDNGPGIPEKDIPHLFDGYLIRDDTVSDSIRGMGLGLSICMSIIKAHKGKMRAMNNLNGGASFEFTLPMNEDETYG